MCRPIRALTQMKGFDITTHVLACFGGAGGQHACAIAKALGIKNIFIHRYVYVWGADSTKLPKLECVHALKGLALPRASYSDEIVLADSRRLHFTLAAVPVLFVHAAVTEAKTRCFRTPC